MNRRDAVKMLGTALSIPALANLAGEEIFLFGREAHARLSAQKGEFYVFKTLDGHQDRTVAAISDLIIPKTDTPGARAVKVNEFIDLMLTNWYKGEERDRFLRGLVELDEQSRNQYKKNLIDCNETQQVELLKSQEAEAISLREAAGEEEMNWGRRKAPQIHFFHMIKWLTLYGYYTSEIGMMEELSYETIPVIYSGCVAS